MDIENTMNIVTRYCDEHYCTMREFLERRGGQVCACQGSCHSGYPLLCQNIASLLNSAKNEKELIRLCRTLIQFKLVEIHKYSLGKQTGENVGWDSAGLDWSSNYAERFAELYDKQNVRDIDILFNECTHSNSRQHLEELASAAA